MKAILRNLKQYFLFAFILIPVGPVSATYTGSPDEEAAINSFISAFEAIDPDFISEPSVMMEDWMYDVTYWSNLFLMDAPEAEPGLENWMASIAYWDYNVDMYVSEIDIALEDWMADPDHWEVRHDHKCADLNKKDSSKMRICMTEGFDYSGRLTRGG
jgi:hypothetical protein